MTTSRLEAFSDGVFAIAITLLVLEFGITESTHDLGGQLLHIWPSYFAYVTSFLTIGIVWVNHHGLFNFVDHVDRAGRRLIRADVSQETLDDVIRSFAPGIPMYAGATLVALASPLASVALYLAIALFYALPPSLHRRKP